MTQNGLILKKEGRPPLKSMIDAKKMEKIMSIPTRSNRGTILHRRLPCFPITLMMIWKRGSCILKIQ
jgi:hypothetical protein